MKLSATTGTYSAHGMEEFDYIIFLSCIVIWWRVRGFCVSTLVQTAPRHLRWPILHVAQ